MSTVEKAAEKLKSLHPEPLVQPEDVATPQVGAVAVGAVSAIERLQEKVGKQDHVTEVAPFWHLDFSMLERAGLLPANGEANRRLADEVRRVKRPLLDNVTGKGLRTIAHARRIVVSSAEPGEGKTFTAVNLALSLAREPDFEVLLVDGDSPKSDLTRALGLEGRPGLMDLLADEQRHAAEAIVRTDVPNLLVVPAGERNALAAELLGSLRMEFVLEELSGRNRRRLIIFDSSPLLAAPESQALIAHMGQVAVVVAAARTRRHALASALQNLNDSQYVGLILNMSRLPPGENHYDHYGRYSGDREGEV